MTPDAPPSDQRTIAGLTAAVGATYGDARAVVDGERVLSFIELAQEARQAARAFIAAGVEKGDRAAVWAPNGAAWIVAALGLQIAGGVLVPLNTRFKGVEAAYILGRTRPRLLLTVGEFLGVDFPAMLAGAAEVSPDPSQPALALPRMILLDDAERADGEPWTRFVEAGAAVIDEAALEARIAEVSPQHTGDILFTSGATGAPKGAMHSQGQGLWMVDIWNRANDLRPGDRQLVVNPFFHSFGYRSGWVSGLMAGMTTWPMAVFEAQAAMALIARARITVLMGAPTLFFAILDHPRRSEFDLSSLRVAHTGSSNVPVDLIRRLREDLGFDLVLTSFGQTESTALISANPPDADLETIARTCGKPLPGVEVRIASHDPATPGEVLVRGPNVMQGYFEDPAATALAIDADGWLHTGDVGRIDADGNLRITDRLKDMVIVGGFNAYPAEVEAALRVHPAIADVAVLGVPDARLGEVCAAAVILRPGAALTLEDLSAWSRERLANYKVPRRLAVVADFPRTPLGKVQKFVLKSVFQAS